MVDYIENMPAELPTDMDAEAATPATNPLFEVNEKDPIVLSEDKVIIYHQNMAKLLFLCKRARPIPKQEWHSYVPE